MTSLIFDMKGHDPQDEWTTERIKEEFFLCLAQATEKIYDEEANAITHVSKTTI